ncbi:MAG: hypothetical protein K2M97_02440, partial [Muribaculaceae bacterium]|nr:hypothetical protein [Muribaculaceae bacterium]
MTTSSEQTEYCSPVSSDTANLKSATGSFDFGNSYSVTVDVVLEGSQSALDAINAATSGRTTIYDLQGRRVNVPAAHGLYIINGQKIAR